jgi:xylan 1,4-beta-xylosidase
VETLKAEASGSPLRQQEVRVGRDGGFSVRLPMRENDVYLVELSGF